MSSREDGEFESLRSGLGAPDVGCADPEHLAGGEVEAGEAVLLSVGVDPLV